MSCLARNGFVSNCSKSLVRTSIPSFAAVGSVISSTVTAGGDACCVFSTRGRDMFTFCGNSIDTDFALSYYSILGAICKNQRRDMQHALAVIVECVLIEPDGRGRQYSRTST